MSYLLGAVQRMPRGASSREFYFRYQPKKKIKEIKEPATTTTSRSRNHSRRKRVRYTHTQKGSSVSAEMGAKVWNSRGWTTFEGIGGNTNPKGQFKTEWALEFPRLRNPRHRSFLLNWILMHTRNVERYLRRLSGSAPSILRLSFEKKKKKKGINGGEVDESVFFSCNHFIKPNYRSARNTYVCSLPSLLFAAIVKFWLLLPIRVRVSVR